VISDPEKVAEQVVLVRVAPDYGAIARGTRTVCHARSRKRLGQDHIARCSRFRIIRTIASSRPALAITIIPTMPATTRLKSALGVALSAGAYRTIEAASARLPTAMMVPAAAVRTAYRR
jgi:hypothetical protein